MKFKIAAGILAFISVFALSRMIVLIISEENFYPLANSIISFFLWLAIWNFFCNVKNVITPRRLIFSLILGIIFSMFMVFGANIFSSETTGIDLIKTWLVIFAGTPFFAALVIWIFNFIDEFEISSDSCESISIKKIFFISWLLIFAAWIPSLLAQFPGIFSYDAPGQVKMYMDNVNNFFQPPAHTILLGFCTVNLGNFLGSHEQGFLIYILLQMSLLSAVLAALIAYMSAKNLSKTFRICCIVFFMFFPMFQIMAISATKDVLFSVFFVAIILILSVSLEKSVKYFYSMIISVSFLCMIFRSQGVYVFVFGMLCGILLIKNQRLKLFKVMAASLGLYFIYVNVMTGIFHYEKDITVSLREMASVPVVQISRVAALRQDELPPEVIETVRNYIPDFEYYKIKNIRGCSDPVRARFQSKLLLEYPHEFFNLWKILALNYPVDYFDAFCNLTSGQWYPDLYFEKYYGGQPYFQYESFKRDSEGYILIERGSFNDKLTLDAEKSLLLIENKTFPEFKLLYDFYYSLAYYGLYEKFPVISMLFSTGFTFWILLILTFYCLYKKNYRALFPASFIIGLWLTMILGPLALYRYTFPLVISIPIFLTYILSDKTNGGEKI